MEQRKLDIKKISIENLFVIIVSYVGVIANNNIISSISVVSLFILAIYWLHKNSYYNFFIALLISSYQSAGFSLYNFRVVGFSLIYILVFLIVLKNWKSIKLKKSLIYYFPLLFFIPYYIISGLFQSYSASYYIIDFLRFISFFLLITIFYNNTVISKSFMEAIKSYLFKILPLSFLIYLPYSLDVSLGKEKGVFFDEAASIFIMACIFFAIKLFQEKKTLLLFIVFTIFLRLKFYYFSSIEILGLIFLFFVNILSKNIRFLKNISFISLLVISTIPFIIQILPNFTIFKFQQVREIIEVIISGNSLILLPFSPKIRILEIIASCQNLQANGLVSLLFGKGFGSFFSYNFDLTNYGITTLYDTGS